MAGPSFTRQLVKQDKERVFYGLQSCRNIVIIRHNGSPMEIWSTGDQETESLSNQEVFNEQYIRETGTAGLWGIADL